MKMHEIIRERRLAKHYTQEQVARYLGVSTPAVSKWEKGNSYPDITLLPALARLLDTDLNTLLSFQDDLSDKETVLILNQVSETMEETGFEAGYQLAMDKIREYPSSDLLICNLALLLDGFLAFRSGKTEEIPFYQEQIEALYRRAAKSSNPSVRDQALSPLISRLLQRQDYEGAQELLDSISDPGPTDKRQIQANILIAKGDLEQAAKVTEEKLLFTITGVQSALTTLMEIALKENRMEDATYLADVDSKCAKLFDLWEYNQYTAHFQLYTFCKNRVKCLQVLLPMLKSLTKKWNLNDSPLYRHVKAKEVDQGFRTMMKQKILESIEEDADTSFLKESQEFQELKKRMGEEGEVK